MYMTPGAKIAFVICMIGILVGGGWIAKQNFDIQAARADTCHREQSDRQVLRRLISFFEGRTLASPTITAKEKPQILAFYNGALEIVPPVNCN